MTEQQKLMKDVHFLTRRESLGWIMVIGITMVFGFLSRGTTWGGDAGDFVNSLNVIASMFALGLPIFLLTGLMYASPTSRLYLQQLSSQDISDRRTIIFRFVQCLVLVGIYTIISTIIIFIVPFNSDI